MKGGPRNPKAPRSPAPNPPEPVYVPAPMVPPKQTEEEDYSLGQPVEASHTHPAPQETDDDTEMFENKLYGNYV